MRALAILFLSIACLLGCHLSYNAARRAPSTAGLVTVPRALVAASSDGKLYLSVPLKKLPRQDGPAEIRSTVTDQTLNTIELMDSPLLFSPDDKAILSISSDGKLVRQSIESGDRQILAKGLPNGPYHYNVDRSICSTVNEKGGLIITNTGKVLGHIQLSGFDSYGNVWGKRSGQSIRVLRDGSIALKELPKNLSQDQSHDRGSMHLHKSHKNVGVDVIWLEDYHSLPQPQWDEEEFAHQKDHSLKTTMITSSNNVLTYGFVPSRAEVYILCADGTTFFKLRASPAKG